MEIIHSIREGYTPLEVVQDDQHVIATVRVLRQSPPVRYDDDSFALQAETTGWPRTADHRDPRPAAMATLIVRGMEFPPTDKDLPHYEAYVVNVASAAIALAQANPGATEK
jgi:hypothetical protein